MAATSRPENPHFLGGVTRRQTLPGAPSHPESRQVGISIRQLPRCDLCGFAPSRLTGPSYTCRAPIEIALPLDQHHLLPLREERECFTGRVQRHGQGLVGPIERRAELCEEDTGLSVAGVRDSIKGGVIH